MGLVACLPCSTKSLHPAGTVRCSEVQQYHPHQSLKKESEQVHTEQTRGITPTGLSHRGCDGDYTVLSQKKKENFICPSLANKTQSEKKKKKKI